MSEKKNGKFLPLGSIVRLKGGQLPVMIIGYTVVPKDDPNTIFDYNATFYPMGTLETNVITPFNHKQIEEVLFYVNEHMHIRDILQSERAIAKYKKLWGEDRFNKLVEFMEADNKASGIS